MNIKIYPEWNVNNKNYRFVTNEADIKIYPEWNVNFFNLQIIIYYYILKSIQSGM